MVFSRNSPYWGRFPSLPFSSGEKSDGVWGKISISYFSFAWHSGNEKKSKCRCCASFSPCRVLLLAALWSIFCGKVKDAKSLSLKFLFVYRTCGI
ncbi:hypothetical protein CEXT_187811 [Caerostris extrusa]|uniref:Uncharacterized protein n=1 Tax=Caerostris extrusa TaxID=172846 RepID=A0AAV4PKW5_CAEEX|nr:hypothetical protein CEXT_187811 [Caerostris extrusa]